MPGGADESRPVFAETESEFVIFPPLLLDGGCDGVEVGELDHSLYASLIHLHVYFLASVTGICDHRRGNTQNKCIGYAISGKSSTFVCWRFVALTQIFI